MTGSTLKHFQQPAMHYKQLPFVLALLFAIGCPIVRAESVSLTDTDAESYISARQISNPDDIQRIHAWYTGLKGLNCYTNIVLMASYRSIHGTASGTTLSSMVGGSGTIVGTVSQGTNGLYFTNTAANYVQYSNPLQGTAIAAYTIAAFGAVDASTNGAAMLIVGGSDAASARAPTLWANGSPSAGYVHLQLGHTYSSDGTGAGQPGDMLSSASTIRGRGITTGPQMLAASFSAGTKTLTPGFDLMGVATGAFGTVWNNGVSWRVGVSLAGGNPLSGTISCVIVANRAWSHWETQAIRRLYHKTIGAGFMPEINLIVEGDSLSAGAAGELVWAWGPTVTNSTHQNRLQVRNLSTSGAQIAAMATDYSTSAAMSRVEFDYAPRQYYALWGANNDTASDPFTVFDSLKSLWTRARSDGFKVIAFTIFKTVGTDANAANRATLNKLIRNSPSFYDVLIDVDRVLELQNYLDTAALGSTAPTFQNDQIHLTSLGHFYLARYISSLFNYP